VHISTFFAYITASITLSLPKMQRASVIIAGILAMASAATQPMLSFNEWAAVNNKNYATETERALRETIFNANAEAVHAHNAKNGSYTRALYSFADMTKEEVLALRTGSSGSLRARALRAKKAPLPTGEGRLLQGPPPPSIDLTISGKIRTPVSSFTSSSYCVGGYAVAAIGAVEFAWNVRYSTTIWGSIQEIIDCSDSYGNRGCDGGYPEDAISYVMDNSVTSESTYSYTATDTSCAVTSSTTKVMTVDHVAGFTTTWFLDNYAVSDGDIASALASGHPVVVNIAISEDSFQSYSGGVYDDWHCGSMASTDTYGLIVGYGTDTTVNKAYYKIRMDQGTSWGESGYIRLHRDQSQNTNDFLGICAIYAPDSLYVWHS